MDICGSIKKGNKECGKAQKKGYTWCVCCNLYITRDHYKRHERTQTHKINTRIILKSKPVKNCNHCNISFKTNSKCGHVLILETVEKYIYYIENTYFMKN